MIGADYFDSEQYPNCVRGHRYALDVVSGKIPNCKYIIGACKRYLSDLEKAIFPFDADAAERFLRVAQRFEHIKGNWPTPNIVFEPWQCWIFMNVFGFQDPRTGFRRFRTAYLEFPRGQGKSALASIVGLYVLALDNPAGNEISCFGTKSDQARIVLDSSRAMAKGNASFLKATGVEVLAHQIKHDSSNSVMRARSSDYGSLDGLNDALSIIDELHAVSQELYDVVVSGLKKRRDSLLLCITTAGTRTDGVGYAQSVYSKRVATQDIEDDQTFAAIYTVDEGDDIFDEATWKKANPNYGISVDPIALESTAKKSKEVQSELANFKVKNLCMWTSEMSAYFDVRKWDACADTELKLESFRGKKCKIGVDLASRIDISTFVSVFKGDDTYYVFDRSYIPEATVAEVNSTLYNDCIAKGYLIATPGEAINQDTIKDDIIKHSKFYKVDEIMFDVWNASGLMNQLSRERLECVEYKQNTANLSEPMKTLDELIRKGNIKHNGSPLMRFCISNVVAKEDANSNVFPRKNSERLKIDLAVALMMALGAWIQDARATSVYDQRSSGLRVL